MQHQVQLARHGRDPGIDLELFASDHKASREVSGGLIFSIKHAHATSFTH